MYVDALLVEVPTTPRTGGRRLQGAGHLDAMFMSQDQTTHGDEKTIFWGKAGS